MKRITKIIVELDVSRAVMFDADQLKLIYGVVKEHIGKKHHLSSLPFKILRYETEDGEVFYK